MELLLILTYAAICIGIFKLFRLPLNKWTVPTAVLGGIVMIGSILLGMNYNHPYSEIGRQYFVTTPIIPNVSGQVISVNVKTNKHVKADEVLFKIDPEPFQFKLDIIKAQLVVAKEDLDRAQKLQNQQSISERRLEQAQAKVEELNGQLELAQYELNQTTIKAPSDGLVTQIAIRKGMRATALPLKPLMIFIPTEEQHFVAWFRQNSTLRLDKGNKAEVAFDGIPGKIFKGEVDRIYTVLAEGQVSPSGTLIDDSLSAHAGRIPVMIKITDPQFKEYAKVIPGGAYAQAAIYSEHAHHLAMIRKILLRMASYMNFVFPLH